MPPTIRLDSSDSIEDLIVRLSEVGFANYSIFDLHSLSMDEKISILSEVAQVVQSFKEYVVIEDYGCLIKHNDIEWWFNRAIDQLNPTIMFNIISIYNVYESHFRSKPSYFIYDLNEMNQADRIGFMKKYVKEFKDMSVDEDINEIKNFLTGYPPQIHYLADVIADKGVSEVLNDPNCYVTQYNKQKASQIIEMLLNSLPNIDTSIINNFLLFLSRFQEISTLILHDILKLRDEYKIIFYQLCSLSICRKIGATKDIVITNSMVCDYISRRGISMPDDIQHYLKEKFNKIDLSDKELGLGEINYYIADSIQNDTFTNYDKLYPSILLKSVQQLYHKKKYRKVIELFNAAKDNAALSNADEMIGKEILFYVCRCYAKLQDKSFYTLLYTSKFSSEKYNFLSGYYKRFEGDYPQALKFYKQCSISAPNWFLVKRELVHVHTHLDEYEQALLIAKENYEKYPDNPFNLCQYFDCLIRMDLTDSIKNTLNTLNKELNAYEYNQNNQALNQMITQMKAQYFSFVREDYNTAINIINSYTKENQLSGDNLIYMQRVLFVIYRKQSDLTSMKQAVKIMKENDENNRFLRLIISREAIIMKHEKTPQSSIKNFIRNSKLSKQQKDELVAKIATL